MFNSDRGARKKGFSLLEILITIVILAVLLALVTGLLTRYRAQTALNAAVERLMSEIPQAQARARTLGIEPANTPQNTTGSSPPGATLVARLVEKLAGQDAVITKEWLIGDRGGSTAGLELVGTTNLPKLELQAADQGLLLEIGTRDSGVFTLLVAVPFRANGEIIPNSPLGQPPASATITLGNGYTQQRLTISPLGRVSRETL